VSTPIIITEELVEWCSAAATRYGYSAIHVPCVDCGDEVRWLRGRADLTTGSTSIPVPIPAPWLGRALRTTVLWTDADLPIPDEPLCPSCTSRRIARPTRKAHHD